MDEFVPYEDTPEGHQRIVDTVVRGLRSQGFQQSKGFRGVCALRGDDGRKCAVGWLLPDEMYAETGEMIGDAYWKVLVPSDRLDHGDMVPRHHALAGDLQKAHDGPTFAKTVISPEDLESRLREVVSKYGLVWPEEEA